MVNLLPTKERKQLRRIYFARFATVFFFLASAVTFAGSLLLAPSYFLAESNANAARKDLGISLESAASRASLDAKEKIAFLKERITILKEYQRAPASALILSHIAADASTDIGVNAISIVFTASGEGTVNVTGKAKTRTALIALGQKLQSDGAFHGASVPVSDLAGGNNIDFSIPFTFSIYAP